jgi:hypothetical protein
VRFYAQNPEFTVSVCNLEHAVARQHFLVDKVIQALRALRLNVGLDGFGKELEGLFDRPRLLVALIVPYLFDDVSDRLEFVCNTQAVINVEVFDLLDMNLVEGLGLHSLLICLISHLIHEKILHQAE